MASADDGRNLRLAHVAALTHILTLDGNLHMTVRSEDGEVLDSFTIAELIERTERNQ